MRILLLNNYYPPYEIGGYEQLCRDVVVRLSDRGHECTVLTSSRGTKESDFKSEPGVFRSLRTLPRKESHLSVAAQFFLTRRQAESYNRRVFREVMKQVDPNVVFIWNLQGLPQEMTLDAESSGVPVAYWLAGYAPAEPDFFWSYWEQRPKKREMLAGIKDALGWLAFAQMRREGKPVHPQMCHVAVVSDYIRKNGIENNTLPTQTEVIYNGVEVESFFRPVPSPDVLPPINILLAGRVAPDKGIHVAVEAIGMLVEKRAQRDFRLKIAGSGPPDYVQQLKQMVNNLGIKDLVDFSGWLPREQMPRLMHSCHILLLPTIHPEPFSRVILEGMAAGLAVVATLTGGTGELVEAWENGLTCDAENSSQMAEKVLLLLEDPELRNRLASAGQKRVMSEFSLNKMVERLECFLERAIAEQSE